MNRKVFFPKLNILFLFLVLCGNETANEDVLSGHGTGDGLRQKAGDLSLLNKSEFYNTTI